MDFAFCTVDEKQWCADDFIAQEESELKIKRRNLLCIECEGDAWFRKSSYGNKVPHFCAHHKDECSLSTSYEVIGEGDGSEGQPAADPDSGIILDLGGDDSNYSVDVEHKEIPINLEARGQKKVSEQVKGGGVKYPAHLSLKNTLYKLVRSDKLYTSDTKIVIPNNPYPNLPEIANQLFVNFKDVHEGLDQQNRIYWGFISDAGYTSDGRLWLNAGNRKDGLSVAINPEITEEFREYFKVNKSIEQLAGCHALIIGDCYYAGSGKPVIWCGNVELIVLRRYRFDS